MQIRHQSRSTAISSVRRRAGSGHDLHFCDLRARDRQPQCAKQPPVRRENDSHRAVHESSSSEPGVPRKGERAFGPGPRAAHLPRAAATRPFLRVHPLRAAEAVQLAAAFMAAERWPSMLAVVTLDARLANAARKEGFELIDLGLTESIGAGVRCAPEQAVDILRLRP